MPTDPLLLALRLADNAAGDYFTKQEWRAAGQAVLRRLAEDLGLTKGTFDIRFNAGGDAVSGEAILHSDRLYVQISSWGDTDAGYARSVKGRKDYVGGPNLWVPRSYPSLLNIAQRILTQVST